MRQRGFTLIEAIVAMAIMGILMAVGMPMYSQWIQNAQIRTAAESIIEGLQLARNEAVKSGAVVKFIAGSSTNSGWEVCLWNTATNQCMSTTRIQTRSGTEGAANVSLAGALADLGGYTTAISPGSQLPGGVTFNGFGRPATAGADLQRIDVRNTKLSAADERRLVILVSLGGQIRLCDPKFDRASNAQGC